MIKMNTPIVEIDGDEMTRVLWRMIKDTLILPFVDLKTEYYDLGLKSRNDTDDEITRVAAAAAKRLGVAVKCATITVNRDRMEEFPELRRMYPSPNATLRAALDGTVFRAPIVLNRIRPAVRSWELPITIARHAYGDIYAGVEYRTPNDVTAAMEFTLPDGELMRVPAQSIKGGSVWRIMHNSEISIRNFARSCFRYAITAKQDLWFCTKDTISKAYDGRFKEIFEEEFVSFKKEFLDNNISYFYTLIDDAAARIMHSRGGFIWALKNYDGDVMSDLMSSAFGSVAMMTSVLVSPEGNFEYEAAHGTVTRHYRKFQKGEQTSTNPVATIFAWTGALRKRAQLDSNTELEAYADKMEKAVLYTIEQGTVTNDLAGILDDTGPVNPVTTEEFLRSVYTKYSEYTKYKEDTHD